MKRRHTHILVEPSGAISISRTDDLEDGDPSAADAAGSILDAYSGDGKVSPPGAPTSPPVDSPPARSRRGGRRSKKKPARKKATRAGGRAGILPVVRKTVAGFTKPFTGDDVFSDIDRRFSGRYKPAAVKGVLRRLVDAEELRVTGTRAGAGGGRPRPIYQKTRKFEE